MLSIFNDKKIWLTGASSGIGLALAAELARRGATLALTARTEDKLLQAQAALNDNGEQHLLFRGDVTDRQRMNEIAAELHKRWGSVDMLIANAGTHIPSSPKKFNAAEYLSIMNVNYGGTLNCVGAILPMMIEQQQGQIVSIASLAGYRGLPRAAAYGASKAALINFMESIRFHLKDVGIKVTIVNPGFVKTPLTDKNDFEMPFLMDAQKAAVKICNGIERNKKEVTFPIPFNWTLKLARILPYCLYEQIVERFVWDGRE